MAKNGKSEKEKNYKDFLLVGGPRDGEELRLDRRPPPFLKLGMPEWCVYEYKQGQYEILLQGDDAKEWRNPEGWEF